MSVRIVIEGPAQVLQDGILISTPGSPRSRAPPSPASSPIAATSSRAHRTRSTPAQTVHGLPNEPKEGHSVVEQGSDTGIFRNLCVHSRFQPFF